MKGVKKFCRRSSRRSHLRRVGLERILYPKLMMVAKATPTMGPQNTTDKLYVDFDFPVRRRISERLVSLRRRVSGWGKSVICD